jgi:hypothetical protein
VSDDTTQRVWDLESGDCTHTIPGHPHRDYCVEVVGSKAVAGGDDQGMLRVFHLPAPPSCAFALSPATVSGLLQALSPKEKPRPKGPEPPTSGLVVNMMNIF